MPSISANSTVAGDPPVEEKLDELLGQLILHASALANSQLIRSVSSAECSECCAQWGPDEQEVHVPGCTVGNVRADLQELIALNRQAEERIERRSSEPIHDRGAAAEERPRANLDYGEPWAYGSLMRSDKFLSVKDMTRNNGELVEFSDREWERITACVNFCAGISNEMLQAMKPLREMSIGVGVGVDAVLSPEGGRQ